MGDLLIQKTVPAEECERFANALTGRECRCDPSMLYTISVKTHGVAEQHQGEPVERLRAELSETTAVLRELIHVMYLGSPLPDWSFGESSLLTRLRATLERKP